MGPNVIRVRTGSANGGSFSYQHRARVLEVRRQVVDMALNGRGIRDTARVLRLSPTTVIAVLKKRPSSSTYPSHVGTPSLFTRRSRPNRARRQAR